MNKIKVIFLLIISLSAMIAYGGLSEAFSSLVISDEDKELEKQNKELHLNAHKEIDPILPFKLSKYSEVIDLRKDRDTTFNFKVTLSEEHIKEYNELSRINQYNPSKDFKELTEKLCSYNFKNFKELKEISIIIKYIDKLENKETKYNYVFAGCSFLK